MTMPIQYKDGTRNTFSLFTNTDTPEKIIVFFPAMGVRASFYKKIAAKLAEIGFASITIDWRGFGHSSVSISRANNHGYKELLEDMKEAIALIKERYPKATLFLLGHSLGGQLGALYASRYPNQLKGLILMTSCLVYYKVWGSQARQVRLVGNLFYPLSQLIGYFPGHRLGFAGKEARNVMKDWCHNALTGQYKTTGDNFDYETALKSLNLPVLSISMEHDTLAIRPAVEALYKKFDPNCPIQHIHVQQSDTEMRPLNHYTWAKEPEYVSQLIVDWVNHLE